MPFKTVEEIKQMVCNDKIISQSNEKINKFLTPWVNGRNYFDGNVFPRFDGYKKLASEYKNILYNKE